MDFTGAMFEEDDVGWFEELVEMDQNSLSESCSPLPPPEPHVQPPKNTKKLTNLERQQIVERILKSYYNESCSHSILKLLAALKSKWPEFGSKSVIIQQDNARPHISTDDVDFMVAAVDDDLEIDLCCEM